jgi:hypothetical protein
VRDRTLEIAFKEEESALAMIKSDILVPLRHFGTDRRLTADQPSRLGRLIAEARVARQ